MEKTPIERIKSCNERRKSRIRKTAEVFTPNFLVDNALNKLPDEVWEENEENTFLDPFCGNGNFLVHILWRKISRGYDPTEALKTIRGLDIVRDNIFECRLRLLKIISIFEDITKEHIKIVFTNIRWLKPGKFPRGSLCYDMSFESNYTSKNVDRWYDSIQKGELELVDLPVKDNDIAPSFTDRLTESVDIFFEK